MKAVEIQFLGGAGTVTGSKFYLKTPEIKIMVDCGLFQGIKELRETNWKKLPINPAEIDVVLLTHGHLDHTGYLPKLVKEGFIGRIIASSPTLHITEIILRDSGKIQEELAEKANKEGFSKHNPALPLYTAKDAERVFPLFKSIDLDDWVYLGPDIRCRFRYNGHIIGATFIELDLYGKIFVFSGDVGRQKDYLLDPPNKPKWADYLFLESTYGDKNHPEEDVGLRISELIHDTIQKRGTLIIPTFAVERLQSIMYQLWQLYRKNKIPNIPIFVDSPMGTNVLEVFAKFPTWHKLSSKEYWAMHNHFSIIESYADTWNTIDDPRSKIVIAGSGMVTGGRVLTYLRQLVDKNSTTVLLVGYQAEGTRGRKLLEGAEYIKLLGKERPVKARIEHIESLSAHADQRELILWLKNISNIPEKVFLVHGEPDAQRVFKNRLKEEFGWNCQIPNLFDQEIIFISNPSN